MESSCIRNFQTLVALENIIVVKIFTNIYSTDVIVVEAYSEF